MATYEETTRGGRNICAMRHFDSVAMDNYPGEVAWQTEEEPILANQVDYVPG